jgi:hypothetical protein
VFVHHFGGDKLGGAGGRQDGERTGLTHRVEDAVRRHVPEGSTVLVVSNGDDELVGLAGQRAWHFPQLDDGTHARHHPADDDEAIGELERLRERGAEYLVVPATSLWWFDHYRGFHRHLDRYRRASVDPATAVIYELDQPVRASAGLP